MLVAYEELAGVVKLIRNGEIVWKMKPKTTQPLGIILLCPFHSRKFLTILF